MASKRIGKEESLSRTRILDAAEKLMRREGYAAVTARSVAAAAGLKHPLVHYYFPSTDDLIVALYRRNVEETMRRMEEVAASKPTFRSLWAFATDSSRTALVLEFMALANHRKRIRREIANYSDKIRERQTEVLASLIDQRVIDPKVCTPLGLGVLMVGIARVLVMEKTLGISMGHADASAFVNWVIEQHEVSRPTARKRRVGSK